MLKFSRLNQYKIFVLILVSIFVLSQTVRGGIAIILYPLNILFLIGLFLLIFVNQKYLYKKSIILLILIIVHSVGVTFLNEYYDTLEIIRMILYLYVPVLLLTINFDSQRDLNLEKICSCSLKFINVIAIFIFLIFLLDFPTNGLFMKLLTKVATSVVWLPDSYVPFTYRYCSYLGHAIYTADIYIIFFILNSLYIKTFKKSLINQKILFLIAFLGVVSTGSKTGILVFTLSALYFSLNEKKRLYSMILVVIVYFAASISGILDLVINRFFDLESGTLNFSTGRDEAWNDLLKTGISKIRLFSGYGYAFTDIVKQKIGDYRAGVINEYPLRTYLYMFGLVNFVAYLYLIILNPIFDQFKKKDRDSIFAMVMIFILINTYNAILSGPDMMILYCVSFIFINMMSTERKRRYE